MTTFDERVSYAPSASQSPRVGWYRYFFADGRWEWSAEVQRMHGYEPGTVTPTTELVLRHKHPDDRGQVAATLDEIRRTRQAFSTRHRIIDAHETLREVIVIGDQLRDDAGVAVGSQGFYVDATAYAVADDELRQDTISTAVAEIAVNRSAIEQAKGMLMVVYRVDADRAFDLLKWRSQVTNVKVRRLAEQLLSDFGALLYDDVLPTRATYDHLLLTAHHRIHDEG